jgi:hypothetical protein
MIGRMMVSAMALTGVAYAQEAQPTADTVTPATNAGTCTTEPAPPPCSTNPVVSSADRTVYDAAFFAQYNPQTALDMVNQTPGFTLNGGDGRRGFSGAVGNVLIDGVRPTAKSQPIDSIISHIPASQVLRLELLRGAAVAGDASGQSVLLNIVRTASAGSGVYDAQLEFSNQYQHRPMPGFDVSYNGRNGQFEWGVGARLNSQNRDLAGVRRFYDGPAGTYAGRAVMHNPRDMRDPYLNGNLAFPLLGGRFSATGQINPEWWFDAYNNFDFFDATDTPSETLRDHFIEEGTNYEIGLNYDRDLGPWTLSLVGLINRNHYENHEQARDVVVLPAPEDTSFTQDIARDTEESIIRGSLGGPITSTQRIEFGGEGAINTLDSALAFTINGVPQVIDNSNITVEEDRAELFAAHTWRPNDRWSVESRLAWETSTLTATQQSGGTETGLAFWKPSVQVSRNFGNNQLRVRVYRDVGQLNFDDFVSAAGITDHIINGGNPQLRPQTDWRAELGGDLHLGPSALSFTLTHHNITDVNDLVALLSDNGTPLNPADDFLFDAPGNIGDAEAWSLNLNFSTPLGPIIPGGRLTVEGEFWDTSVTDPVTGRQRIISYQPESNLTVSFRQDFNAQHWSWGIEANKQGETQGYRLHDVDTQEEGPWIDLWWETTALPNHMKLRLWAANIGNGSVLRDRRFFNSPDRAGPLDREQVTFRHFTTGPWLTVELSGTF